MIYIIKLLLEDDDDDITLLISYILLYDIHKHR